MKKLPVLLTLTAASVGIYLALDATGQLDSFRNVPPTPVVASAPVPDMVEEIKAADEPVPESVQAQASAPAAAPVTAPAAAPVSVAKVKAPQAQDIKLIVREIKFEGATAFSQAELKGVVSEFVGQELTIEQAMAIPAQISKHYQNHNMVARATLVGALAREDGVLKVGVIESQIKPAQLDKALTTMVTPEPMPMHMLAPPPVTSAPVPAPAPVAVSQVAKLEVSEDASVVTKFAEMSPNVPMPSPKSGESQEDAETAFILKQYAHKSRQYELLFDNYGYSSTGSNRIGAGLVWNDTLSKGDTLSLQGLKSQGSQYLQMAYNWTTGLDGLKLGANLSSFNFDVVNDLQNAVNLSGDGIKKGLLLAYDLVNSPNQLSTLGLHYDVKSIHTTAATFTDSAYYDTKVMGIKFKGFEREMVPGGAVFSYDAMFSKGTVDMAGSPNEAADLSGEQTAGEFSKFRLSASVFQPLGGVHAFYTGLTLQRASKNLDGSEKIYLGGPLGVRAYGVGEGMGSDGELVTFEFRQKLTANTTLSEFYDRGHVRAWHDGSAPGAPANNSATLQGYGLSLTHRLDTGATLRGTWAHRLGDEPDTAAMPRGHSGQYDRNRFWVSLESRF
jgi:hemolysin activation/secretion protein